MKRSKKFPVFMLLTWNEPEGKNEDGYFSAFKAASEIPEDEHGALVGIYRFSEQRRFVTSKKVVS